MASQSTAHPTGPASTTATTVPTAGAITPNHRHPVIAGNTITTSTTNTTVAVPATITTSPTSTTAGTHGAGIGPIPTVTAVAASGRALPGDAVVTHDRAATAGSTSTTHTRVTALPAGTTGATSSQE